MTSIYCSVSDIRDLTGLSVSDISDSIISGIIQHSSSQLNSDIQIEWKDEKVTHISNEKENDIDSSNKVFYTKHFPIGDRDNNGVVSGADIYAYTIDSDNERTQIVVSGITVEGTEKASVLGGPIYLSVAPNTNDALYFSYVTSPVDMETPHKLVNLACIQLAAALCFTSIDVTKVQSYRIGKVAVMKQSQAFDIYRKQYYETINKIRQEILKVEHGTVIL